MLCLLTMNNNIDHTNYDLVMQEELKHLEGRPTLLLHVCCGPCSSNVIKMLSEYFDITIYYSNSNIYPEEEYNRRYQELLNFIPRFNKDYNQHIKVVEDAYDNIAYTAYNYAKEHDFDYWTTVLSVSPHKISRWINEIGNALQQDKPKFLNSDFKKRNGYLKSTQMASEYGMYRQDYCGCIYSYEEAQDRINRQKEESRSE